MNKFGYRPTNGGYSAKKGSVKKPTMKAHKRTAPPMPPKSGSAQTKIVKAS